MKPCYPTATELQEQELRLVLEIFQEDSDEEDFLGFSKIIPLLTNQTQSLALNPPPIIHSGHNSA